MLNMFGRGDDAKPAIKNGTAAETLPPANANGPVLRAPTASDIPAKSIPAKSVPATTTGSPAAKRPRLFENPPTIGQYLYHLASDIRNFTRKEIGSAVVGATPSEVQRLARLAAKLKGRYLAQALDLVDADHGPVMEADVRFLERSRFMYEEVERALDSLRQAIETGDLALEGLKRD
jgi:hypothetical protein